MHVIGDWDDKIYVKMVDYIGDEAQGHDQAGVLKICELDVHGSELNPPSDVGVLRWWRLEPQ